MFPVRPMSSRLHSGSLAVSTSASVAFGLMAIALLWAGARWWMPSTLAGPIGDAGWTSRSRAWFTTKGFFQPEMDPQTLHQFTWATGSSTLRIPNLDRSQGYQLSLRVAGARAPGLPPSWLRLGVDGVVVATMQTPERYERIDIIVPPSRTAGVEVTLDASRTVVPGPNDRRALGLVADEISLTPLGGHFRPTGAVALRAGLATMFCVLGVWLCGPRVRVAVVLAAAITTALMWLLLLDGAFLGPYIDRLVRIGSWIAIAGAFLALARWRWPAVAGLPECWTVIALVLGTLALKLAVFVHPLVTIGDIVFHAHRARTVYGGTHFLTSVTPRPFFEFPYAIGLYLAAQPLARWFRSVLALADLLRGMALLADTMVALALYAAARRCWNDSRIAVWCAVLWLCAQAPLQALSNGNLTNVFGQALFGMAMAMIIWSGSGTGLSMPIVVVGCGLLAGAFLSHFGTLLTGIPMAGAIAGLLIAAGRDEARRVGIRMLVALVVATTLSYGAYYAHYNDLYAKTFARVVTPQSEVMASKLVASPTTKFRHWISGTSDDYAPPGWPTALTAGAGALLLAKRRRRDGLTLALAAWGLMWAAIVAVEMFSAIELRANLAAAPVFACLGAYVLGALAARGGFGGGVAIAGTLPIVWRGVHVCLASLGVS